MVGQKNLKPVLGGQFSTRFDSGWRGLVTRGQVLKQTSANSRNLR